MVDVHQKLFTVQLFSLDQTVTMHKHRKTEKWRFLTPRLWTRLGAGIYLLQFVLHMHLECLLSVDRFFKSLSLFLHLISAHSQREVCFSRSSWVHMLSWVHSNLLCFQSGHSDKYSSAEMSLNDYYTEPKSFSFKQQQHGFSTSTPQLKLPAANKT